MPTSPNTADTASTDSPAQEAAVAENAADTTSMRQVSSHLEADIRQTAEIVLSVVAAQVPGLHIEEELSITVDDASVSAQVIEDPNGTRQHLLREVPVGRLVVDYRAEVTPASDPTTGEADSADSGEATGEATATDAADRVLYLRPSRYCESDTLAAVAGAEFADLTGKDLLDAVTSWVGTHVAYTSGSSRVTDGALHTYIARRGVCRDFAHLVVTLMRARRVPARYVVVYAPGLRPMDFHAVAEVQLDDGWYVVDATGLAPREGLLRIATGRDAADVAFLTVHSGRVDFSGVKVSATIEPELPADDVTRLVQLA